MIAYEEKLKYLYDRQLGRCAISKVWLNDCAKVDLDHYRIRNKTHNRVKYPLLIDSILNLRAVSNDHHSGFTSKGKGWGDYRAWKLEGFLRRHPKIAQWVNNPGHALFSCKEREIA